MRYIIPQIGAGGMLFLRQNNCWHYPLPADLAVLLILIGKLGTGAGWGQFVHPLPILIAANRGLPDHEGAWYLCRQQAMVFLIVYSL